MRDELLRDELLRDGWCSEAATALAAIIGGTPRGIAALDFDDTCIAGDIGDAIFHHAAERALLPGRPYGVSPSSEFVDPVSWLDAASRLLDERGPAEGYAYVLRAFAGVTEREFDRHVRAVLEHELSARVGTRPFDGRIDRDVRSGIRYRQPVVHLARRLMALGWHVVLVSGSARRAVQIAAEPLGVAPENVVGLEVEIADGVMTDRIVGPLIYGPGKVTALRAVLPRPPDLAVGDSHNDLELLRWADAAVVIDGGDENSLGERAREEGWVVQPVGVVWRPVIADPRVSMSLEELTRDSYDSQD